MRVFLWKCPHTNALAPAVLNTLVAAFGVIRAIGDLDEIASEVPSSSPSSPSGRRGDGSSSSAGSLPSDSVASYNNTYGSTTGDGGGALNLLQFVDDLEVASLEVSEAASLAGEVDDGNMVFSERPMSPVEVRPAENASFISTRKSGAGSVGRRSGSVVGGAAMADGGRRLTPATKGHHRVGGDARSASVSPSSLASSHSSSASSSRTESASAARRRRLRERRERHRRHRSSRPKRRSAARTRRSDGTHLCGGHQDCGCVPAWAVAAPTQTVTAAVVEDAKARLIAGAGGRGGASRAAASISNRDTLLPGRVLRDLTAILSGVAVGGGADGTGGGTKAASVPAGLASAQAASAPGLATDRVLATTLNSIRRRVDDARLAAAREVAAATARGHRRAMATSSSQSRGRRGYTRLSQVLAERDQARGRPKVLTMEEARRQVREDHFKAGLTNTL